MSVQILCDMCGEKINRTLVNEMAVAGPALGPAPSEPRTFLEALRREGRPAGEERFHLCGECAVSLVLSIKSRIKALMRGEVL